MTVPVVATAIPFGMKVAGLSGQLSIRQIMTKTTLKSKYNTDTETRRQQQAAVQHWKDGRCRPAKRFGENMAPGATGAEPTLPLRTQHRLRLLLCTDTITSSATAVETTIHLAALADVAAQVTPGFREIRPSRIIKVILPLYHMLHSKDRPRPLAMDSSGISQPEI